MSKEQEEPTEILKDYAESKTRTIKVAIIDEVIRLLNMVIARLEGMKGPKNGA